MKKIFLFAIPISICNLRCHYCYLAQRDSCYEGVMPEFRFSPEEIAYAMRKDRVGGEAYFNLCADGETLLLPDIAHYVELLAREGHYIEIVSNMVLTKKLKPLISLGSNILSHINFKCSLHYLELKKRGLLDRFATNVNAAWNAGASITVEITPSDELIPYISEVKEYCLENFGALPHLTVARNDATDAIERLTNLNQEEYESTWGEFNSAFFEFKESIFGVKQTGFCEAGSWMYYVNMATGDSQQCYKGRKIGNIFNEPEKPLPDMPIGSCMLPHCYNGHMMMTAGLIDGLTGVGYGDIRDRTRADGTHWLYPELKTFFNSKLGDSNSVRSDFQKKCVRCLNPLSWGLERSIEKLSDIRGTNHS